jgi:hypothetical protein
MRELTKNAFLKRKLNIPFSVVLLCCASNKIETTEISEPNVIGISGDIPDSELIKTVEGRFKQEQPLLFSEACDAFPTLHHFIAAFDAFVNGGVNPKCYPENILSDLAERGVLLKPGFENKKSVNFGAPIPCEKGAVQTRQGAEFAEEFREFLLKTKKVSLAMRETGLLFYAPRGYHEPSTDLVLSKYGYELVAYTLGLILKKNVMIETRKAELTSVDINKIISTPPPADFPESDDEFSIADLKTNVSKIKELIKERSGVVSPIIVTQGENGKYYVVDGRRRLEVLKQNGEKHVPAVILPPLRDKKDFFILKLSLNTTQRRIKQKEVFEEFLSIYPNEEKERLPELFEEVLEQTGLEETKKEFYVKQFRNYLEASQKLGRPITHISKAAEIAKAERVNPIALENLENTPKTLMKAMLQENYTSKTEYEDKKTLHQFIIDLLTGQELKISCHNTNPVEFNLTLEISFEDGHKKTYTLKKNLKAPVEKV